MSVPPTPRRRGSVSIWTGGDDLDQARAALDSLSDAVRRSRVPLLAWVALCLVVASVYARSTTPEYLASVQLVLRGGHKAQDGPDGASLSHQLELSGAGIETQLALIRSPGFLQPLFDILQLDAAPELQGSDPAATPSAGTMRRQDSFGAFRGRVGARRVGLSTAFEVSYRAPDPAQAVRVANAIAAAYVYDRIRTAMVDTRAFTPYLKTRIAAIMTEAALAAEAVHKGGLPDAEFVDADVRLLGSARIPLSPAYPRFGPIAAFAIGFGLITGLLVVAAMHGADQTIRSRAQLRNACGIEAFGVAMQDGALASQAALVTLAMALAPRPAPGERHGEGRRLRAVGLLSWADSGAPRAIGAGLAEVMRLAGTPARLVDPAAGPPREPGEGPLGQGLAAALERPQGGPEEVAIVALPAPATSFAAHAVLPLLDAVVLVVLAGRTTHAELRRALRARGGVPVAAVVLVETRPVPRRRPGRSWPLVRRLTVGATHNNTSRL